MTDPVKSISFAGTRQAFCEEHFHIEGLTWYDRVGIKVLARDRIARVELSTRTGEDVATVGSYVCLDVKIVHRLNGDIDHKVFTFRDYLHERCDRRDDLPHEPMLVRESGMTFDWSIALPTGAAKDRLMSAVHSYITTWEGYGTP